MSSRFCFSRFLRPIVIAISLALLAAWPSLARAQSYPPEWKSTSSYAIGDQVQLNGNVLRATHAVTPGGFKYDEWELWEVRANSNVMIGSGQTFTTFPAAWAYVQNARIAEGAYLHLYISTAKMAFSENFTSPVNLNHPFGANISIIGDNQADVNLSFSATGFTLDSGHSIALISGMTLTGSQTGSAIQLIGNASIKAVTNVPISLFRIGIDSQQGSSIYCDKYVTITQFGTAASAQDNASVVFEDGAIFSDGNLAGSNGLYEAFGGYIQAKSSYLTGCVNGVQATQGGVVNIEGAKLDNNTYGILATMRAHVDCENATFPRGVNQNYDYDIECVAAATVDATGTTTGLTNSLGKGDGSYILGA